MPGFFCNENIVREGRKALFFQKPKWCGRGGEMK